MRDYHTAERQFDLRQAAQRDLHGTLDALNACVECCDRHLGHDRVALYQEIEDGQGEQFTFEQLSDAAGRFATVLAERGVGAGDRVAGLLPRRVELLITVLATWRLGAVYQPLFTAFGPKAIEHRVQAADTRLIVTDRANREKLDEVETGAAVITVDADRAGDGDFHALLEASRDHHPPVMLDAQSPFLMMFTSGTTGLPKAVPVPLKAILAFQGYLRDAVGLRQDDRFWNLADPGWAYGLYYAITGPLALGHATTFYAGGFTVESTCRVIEKYGITNLAGSPTAFRLMMAGGAPVVAALRGRLRAVSSAGEPLTPAVIRWFAEELGVTIHDHYGQTELGMVLCNHHALRHPVRQGAAGMAVPGHRVVVVNDQGQELPAGEPGILAVDRSQSPLFWFDGYPSAPGKSFLGDYYLSGDTVEGNEDGTISFVGRDDDIITTSGYRVGPFDVESALIEHPAVVEAAVVGVPDPERTEIVKAFVVTGAGHGGDEALARELQEHVRHRLSAHAYPRRIEFVDSLPKTPSGKIQRFLLRRQEDPGR